MAEMYWQEALKYSTRQNKEYTDKKTTIEKGGVKISLKEEISRQSESILELQKGDKSFNGIVNGADPTGTADSYDAIMLSFANDGYCFLPYGIYKISKTVTLNEYMSRFMCLGELVYEGNESAISVQNGYCSISINTIRSNAKGVSLVSRGDNFKNGMVCYCDLNIDRIISKKSCIILDSTNGGMHYNVFNGVQLLPNRDIDNSRNYEKEYNGIEIVNGNSWWNSRNIFNNYVIANALNGVKIEGHSKDLCYGNTFANMSFESNTINFYANNFMNTIISDCAMQEKSGLEHTLVLKNFGKGNRFSFTEIVIGFVDVDYANLVIDARIEITGYLINDSGTIVGDRIYITANGSYTPSRGVIPKRISNVPKSDFINLNSVYFYGYADSGEYVLPDYIGKTKYKEHEFFYCHYYGWNAITIKDSDGNIALDVPKTTENEKKIYHCIYLEGIGWTTA